MVGMSTMGPEDTLQADIHVHQQVGEEDCLFNESHTHN